jgi:hypothetical protein
MTRHHGRSVAWVIVAIAVALGLYVAALSNDFYNATSPWEFGPHVVMRKVYSVGAFALVAYLIARALAQVGIVLPMRVVIAIGAGYSGAIEVGQFTMGSLEGPWWNLFDVACGAVGGLIAARLPGGSASVPKKPKRVRLTIRRPMVQPRNRETLPDVARERSREA